MPVPFPTLPAKYMPRSAGVQSFSQQLSGLSAEKTAADVLIDELDDDVRTMLEDSGVRMEGVCRLLEKEEISE